MFALRASMAMHLPWFELSAVLQPLRLTCMVQAYTLSRCLFCCVLPIASLHTHFMQVRVGTHSIKAVKYLSECDYQKAHSQQA